MQPKLSFPGIFGLMALVVLVPRSAHAYIDPGTGSFVLQMLVASLLGALFTAKLWFRTVKGFLMRLLGRGTPALDVRGEQADVAVAGKDPADTP